MLTLQLLNEHMYTYYIHHSQLVQLYIEQHSPGKKYSTSSVPGGQEGGAGQAISCGRANTRKNTIPQGRNTTLPESNIHCQDVRTSPFPLSSLHSLTLQTMPRNLLHVLQRWWRSDAHTPTPPRKTSCFSMARMKALRQIRINLL